MTTLPPYPARYDVNWPNAPPAVDAAATTAQFESGLESKRVLSTFPSIPTAVDNIRISQGLEEIAKVIQQPSTGAAKRSLVAQVPSFELHYFGCELAADKPYYAVRELHRSDFETCEELKWLRGSADSILSGTHEGSYVTIAELRQKVREWVDSSKPSPSERWELSDGEGE